MYYVYSLVPRLPPLTRNYCVTYELVQKKLLLHEFKGHAIIARKGGSLGHGNEATMCMYLCNCARMQNSHVIQLRKLVVPPLESDQPSQTS